MGKVLSLTLSVYAVGCELYLTWSLSSTQLHTYVHTYIHTHARIHTYIHGSVSSTLHYYFVVSYSEEPTDLSMDIILGRHQEREELSKTHTAGWTGRAGGRQMEKLPKGLNSGPQTLSQGHNHYTTQPHTYIQHIHIHTCIYTHAIFHYFLLNLLLLISKKWPGGCALYSVYYILQHVSAPLWINLLQADWKACRPLQDTMVARIASVRRLCIKVNQLVSYSFFPRC